MLLDALAIVAFLLMIVVIGATIDHFKSRRKSNTPRPFYKSGQNQYAIADWQASCEKSLEWSRSRRKRSK